MLGIDERTLRVVWTVFLFSLALAVIYFIRETLILFAIAIFFAYLLSPIVRLIERFIPKRKSLALAIVYIALVGALVAIGFEVIPLIASEATSFVTRLPGLVTSGSLAKVQLPAWLQPMRVELLNALSKGAINIETSVVPLLQREGSRILSGLSLLLPIILVPILAFFFLKDGEQLRVSLLGAVEDRQDRSLLDRILEDVHDLLSKYIRALVFLAAAAFIGWTIFLSLLHYPYELLLAGLAGILEFIPVVGPVAALAIMVVATAVNGSGAGVIWIVVFWGCYRIFQDYVLSPYLMSSGVEVHPLLVLFGVLAGEALGGVPGMFFSVPVIACLRIVYSHLRSAYHSQRLVRTSDLRRQVGSI